MPLERGGLSDWFDERADKEEIQWTNKKVVFSTPQVCKNTHLPFPVPD
jgi:hypothetical protein